MLNKTYVNENIQFDEVSLNALKVLRKLLKYSNN